jgi:hypothetical protein
VSAAVQSLSKVCPSKRAITKVNLPNLMLDPPQNALQHHKIDMKDLSQNHIDGSEFQNEKTEDSTKNGKEAKS